MNQAPETLSLHDYIDRYYNGVQADFARAQGVLPPQITQWLQKDIFVEDHVMYTRRRMRELNPPE